MAQKKKAVQVKRRWQPLFKSGPMLMLLLMVVLHRSATREMVLSAQTIPDKKISMVMELQPTPTPSFVKTSTNEPGWLTARAAAVYDLESWELLYGKNLAAELLPASTTKVMTALVAIELYPLDDLVTITRSDRTIGQTADLIPGEQFSIHDLLYAMLLNSGNDAALSIAQHDPKGYSSFVERMNTKAKELGMIHSRFSNVSGLDSPGHYASVQDLALATRAAWQHETFRSIVGTKSYTITSRNTRAQKRLFNRNQLLGSTPEILGGKTGTTPQAGECLITIVSRDEHPLIVVLFGSLDRYAETTQLIEWTYANHRWN